MRRYHVTTAMLTNWGACDEGEDAVEEHGEYLGAAGGNLRGIPVTHAALDALTDSAWSASVWLGFLLESPSRWDTFREIVRRELAAEVERGLDDLVLNSPHVWAMNRLGQSFTQGGVHAYYDNLVTYQCHYYGQTGQMPDMETAQHWLLDCLLRTLDAEPEGSPLDVYGGNHDDEDDNSDDDDGEEEEG